MYKRYFILLLLGYTTLGWSQEKWRNPLEFPLYLAGNFGELRANHFHSGIDMKTQGVTGKAVHAVQEGYVSRVSVSPWGYGNALYLSHPDGTTTVYGHLDHFIPKIADYIRQQQYKLERFQVDLTLTPDQIPVKEGEIVAYSGNTGSSGGPHVHFEIRDTETEEVMDPLPYYKHLIKDNKPPKFAGILICPQPGSGIVNGKTGKTELKVTYDAKQRPVVNAKITAWGKIGFAIKANDYMNETSNVYGVRQIKLTEGKQTLFLSDLDRFAFSETRYLNSLIDYSYWSKHRSFYTKCFIDPGNRLRFLSAKNRGIIDIEEEKTYTFTFTITDDFGNQSRMNLQVVGKKQAIPASKDQGTELFHWHCSNQFGAKGIRLFIPKGNLYTDLDFVYRVKEEAGRLADIHILHNEPVPLHEKAKLSLRILRDTLEHKNQYGIVQWKGKRGAWIGGTYRDGWIDGNIRELGTYTVSADTVAPNIKPIQPEQWNRKRIIRFQLTDNLSGVDTYKGTIDGKFVLFQMNNRSVISCQLNQEQIKRGDKHQLHLVVTDACGNRSEYNYSFAW